MTLGCSDSGDSSDGADPANPESGSEESSEDATAPGQDGSAEEGEPDGDEPGGDDGLGGVEGDGGTPDDPDGTPGDPDDTTEEPDPEPSCDVAPRRVPVHRLNRAEYTNSIRDLIGMEFEVADGFPTDDHAFGFDNNAEVLTMSTSHVEKYVAAAEGIIAEALYIEAYEPFSDLWQAELLGSDGCGQNGDYWNLCYNAQITSNATIEIAGDYVFSARAFGQQAGPEVAKMQLLVDNAAVATIDVHAPSSAPETYETTVALTPGSHTFTVAFINDYYEPPADRNLLVDWFSVEGPAELPIAEISPVRDDLLFCDVEAAAPEGLTCVQSVLSQFATRAWRRPLVEAEIQRFMEFIDVALSEGDPREAGVRLAMTAIISSPHFIYRYEVDPAPGEPARALDGWELASRLSYFLWSSMPDEELFSLAESDSLTDDEVLAEQVSRMLADPKAIALVENFAGQWLYTRGLDDKFKDSATYPLYNVELAESMRLETELFIADFLLGEQSLLDILDADFTYVDASLAALYEWAEPGPPGFIKVSTGDGPRRGILGHASLLSVTSHPARTSPVLRGKWIVSQLMCIEPGAPPNNVPTLEEEEAKEGDLKTILEQHANDPNCSPCHSLMDPLGFALENFDGIGQWRDTYVDGTLIDSSGVLPSGDEINSPQELAESLKANPLVPRCVANQAATYALGRGLHPVLDICALDAITEGFSAGGYTFDALAKAIVMSPIFRTREAVELGQ